MVRAWHVVGMIAAVLGGIVLTEIVLFLLHAEV